MSIIRVEISPEVLKDAVGKSQRTLTQVRNRFNNFDRWLSKELNPTFHQLKDLSTFLRVPFGYLLLESPVQEHIPLLEFRTIDTESIQHPSRELIDTIRDMERKQAWLREAYLAERKEPLNFVGSLHQAKDNEPVKIAEHIRSVINLDKKWYLATQRHQPTFNYLRKILNESRISVMQNGIALNNTYRRLDINEFRAFTLIDEYAPLIFINSRDSNNGKTFSLFHELVHIFFGQSSLYNDDFQYRNKYDNPLEIICNSVAGELIAPTDLFINKWSRIHQNIDNPDEKISTIANDFKVSRLVIARKALDQNYIDQDKYNEISAISRKQFQQEQERETQRSSNGGHAVNNALSRLDYNFIDTLISNVEQGDIQYTQAYRLAGIGRGVFEGITERLRGERQ